MSDWPPDLHAYGSYGTLSTAGEGSPVGDAMANGGLQFTAAAAWSVANTALFVPVVVRAQTTVFQLAWINGGTASGNLDAGIYDRGGNLLVAAGATAQGTISVPQLADITDTTLQPGLYYLAMAVDNVTATFVRGGSATTGPLLRASGCAQMASAYPLPSTATFGAASLTFGVPLLAGATAGSVI